MVGLQVHKSLNQKFPITKEQKISIELEPNPIAAAGCPPSEPQNADFIFIKFITKIILGIVLRFWALSGAAVLAIILLYWLYGGLLAFSLLCFAFSGILYHAGDWLLFHPDQPPHSRLYVPSPKMFGLPYENLYIRTKDGIRINIVLIKQQSERITHVPTVLFLHGNAGNIGHRLMNARGLYNLGYNVLMVEYRGYGLSDGVPSEDGLYLDAQSAMDFLLSRPDVNPQGIIVFGRSLGAAVAVDLACKAQYHEHIAALILENTFTCIPETARVLFNMWIVRLLPSWCFKNQFNTRRKLKFVKMPTLFISGLADILIPPWMMMELYQASGSSLRRIARFESGTHNDTWQCEGYLETISLFINEILNNPSTSASDSHHYMKEESTVQLPPQVI